ncbi:hypothetical protein H4582DRAFT_205437 [Lactarius indigo]|nr:hypothetical protein H4582DRAFT_205437 [Lactarius indigo]
MEIWTRFTFTFRSEARARETQRKCNRSALDLRRFGESSQPPNDDRTAQDSSTMSLPQVVSKRSPVFGNMNSHVWRHEFSFPHISCFGGSHIGGNHEVWSHLWELYHHGGSLAPNIYFLGSLHSVECDPSRWRIGDFQSAKPPGQS